MEVVAYLPRQLLNHLRVVLGQEHTLTATGSWVDLQAAIQERLIDLLVVDPAASGSIELPELLEVIEQFPSLPVVVYTVLSPATIKVVVQLAKRGVEHVVLNRFDDEPRRFLQLLERVPASALSELMLQELAEPLAALPVVVCRAVEQLFRSPGRFRSAQDLAAAAGMNSRTLYRNLQPAGLYSPRMLVVCARLLRAYAYIRDPGRSIKEIAKKAGYHSPWQLSQQMREVTGMTPRRVRQGITPQQFVSLLATELRRGKVEEVG